MLINLRSLYTEAGVAKRLLCRGVGVGWWDAVNTEDSSRRQIGGEGRGGGLWCARSGGEDVDVRLQRWEAAANVFSRFFGGGGGEMQKKRRS